MRILMLILALGASLAAQTATEKRLKEAAAAFTEMMTAGDKGIPQELLDHSACAVILPNLKQGAFIVGAKFGRGFFTCRNDNGVGWKSPAAVRLEGGSVGFQIGGSATDVIMLVKSARGGDKLAGSRFTIGGEASAAAGPVGRESKAMTDAQMTAEILSWSRSRGVFAGVSVQGSTLREDQEGNKDLYGKEMTTRQVLDRKEPAPRAVAPLLAALNKYSGRAGQK